MAKNQAECAVQAEETAGAAAKDGSVIDQAAFTAEERERLQRLRRQVATGQRSDAYPIDKRQDFVRWLIDHGKLSDN